MTNLSPTQHDLLKQAARRDDGLVIVDITTSVRKALIARGFVAADGDALHITDLARSTLNLPPALSEPGAPVADMKLPTTGKLATIANLLRRPAGASITEMQTATGWQAHSVRGALAGPLKTRYLLAIESRKTTAGRIYCVSDTPTAHHTSQSQA